MRLKFCSLIFLTSLLFLVVMLEWTTFVSCEPRVVRELSKPKPFGNHNNNNRTRKNKRGTFDYPKFSPRLKFLPFELPENYSNLQIPSIAVARLKAFASDEIMDEFGVIMYAVSVIMRIRSVNEVDELNQEITFTADLILRWQDFVISLHTINSHGFDYDDVIHEYDEQWRTLDQSLLHKIWKPDVFIENMIKVEKPELISPPASIRFNQVTGKVVYGARLRVKMECEMDFHYYPADTQECRIALRSSNYEDKDLSIYWDYPHGAYLEDCGEPNFDLYVTDSDKEFVKEPFIADQFRTFGVLTTSIRARRKMSYHIVQTFIPSVFFIIITWLCFLIPPSMIEARIGVTMTTLLTLTAMFASVRESTPIVSYVRAIDIWMLVCIFFVFLTLLQFTLILWLKHPQGKENDENISTSQEQVGIQSDQEQTKQIDDNEDFKVQVKPADPASRTFLSNGKRNSTRKEKIKEALTMFCERHSFLSFSILFTLFNAIYWPWLMIKSNHFDWEVNHDINCPELPETENS